MASSDAEKSAVIVSEHGSSIDEHDDNRFLSELGYRAELKRNRSMATLLFQSLSIAAIPFAEGSPLINSIYGGGQLSIFLGWIIVMILQTCVYVSLAEIASRYPTSAGPYFWSHRLAKNNKHALSFMTGWIWVIGNWTITLSVNFGFASLLAATLYINYPDLALQPWQLLLIFYAVLFFSFVVCMLMNDHLPLIDTLCAVCTVLSIFVTLIVVSAKAAAGRNSAAVSLGYYDPTLSGWGSFSFFIGILPAAYCQSAMAMITSMAEEVHDPSVKLPRALALTTPVAGLVGFFWVIPLCVVLPPLEDVLQAPLGQVLPYILQQATGSNAGGVGLTSLVLLLTIFCSVSITTCASRTTWAFARDGAMPLGGRLWSRVDGRLQVPVWSLVLVTVVQALLGLISLGSATAFNAFVSAGVIGLAVTYAVPIAISFLGNRRREVSSARWSCGPLLGPVVNAVALLWIAFELVLFSMPVTLPTTPPTMNFASVIVVGFFLLSVAWYFAHARKVYRGPPEGADLLRADVRAVTASA